MSESMQGSCLCKAITVSVTPSKLHVDACHCTICRTWGGGPMFAIGGLQDFQLKGSEHVSVYPSSEWANRGFCRHCGTHLYFHLNDQDQYLVPAGLVAGDHTLTFHMEVFIDEKPPFYEFANPTRKLTGEELFKLYSGQA